MLNIVLFGPPGSGKGTQSERLIKQFELIHLSTGDILRAQIAEKTKLGLEAKQIMDRGELVPDNVVVGMISGIIENNKNAKGFIFDGFPRTIAQAEALDEMLIIHSTKVNLLLMLDVEEEVLIKRLTLRGEKSGRKDDVDINIIQNRINVYHSQTKPVLEYYKKQGKAFQINGVQTEEDVYSDIIQVIGKVVIN
ncbi:MAG: adenylate kinase [Bacteroidetes bacterium CG02_land_8_20_14_3_00_31_25]|nr:MAG: adenylate kinase [Bacteroidetes bacterium CG02_land_8_20_14_3_00_31_25]PIX34119.1 MAG: adenylate kinase [Bacteroidetes bacterium CG_4_8_14_3_um_filter_31_14]